MSASADDCADSGGDIKNDGDTMRNGCRCGVANDTGATFDECGTGRATNGADAFSVLVGASADEMEIFDTEKLVFDDDVDDCAALCAFNKSAFVAHL